MNRFAQTQRLLLQTLIGNEALVPFRKSLAESPEKTQKNLASATDESVKRKYDWLLNEVALRLPEIE
ncbi:hypothetical protein [Paraburkholderia sp. GAS42]|uniref:hypothetical protein n=1 Tax=Paraburkholderia sp. GAS42 TaxID=3035135 RepID=UPI003D1A98E5